MPKDPYTTDILSLIQRWVEKYYNYLREDKKTRSSHEIHYKAVEELNTLYLQDLEKHELHGIFTTEEIDRELYRQQIDFLTGVYAKQKELSRMDELRNKLKAIPNRHYKPQT